MLFVESLSAPLTSLPEARQRIGLPVVQGGVEALPDAAVTAPAAAAGGFGRWWAQRQLLLVQRVLQLADALAMLQAASPGGVKTLARPPAAPA